MLRTCVCASLAGIWALITASRIDGDKQPALKTSMVQVERQVAGAVVCGHAVPDDLVLRMVPASQRALLTLGIDTINSGTFSTVTRMALIIIVTSATIIGVAYFLAYRNPTEFNLSHALAVLLLALMATGAGEYSREMLRKPYVIGRWMYSNGVRVPSVSKVNANGYLAESNWVWNGSRVRATRVERRSSAASADRATRWRATGRFVDCSPDAIAPTSKTSSSCCMRTRPTRRTAASCRPWWERSRTSMISPNF